MGHKPAHEGVGGFAVKIGGFQKDKKGGKVIALQGFGGDFKGFTLRVRAGKPLSPR